MYGNIWDKLAGIVIFIVCAFIYDRYGHWRDRRRQAKDERKQHPIQRKNPHP